ncbi:GNAT family N-acetyltransferase [Tamlana sp. 2_MG-2023]|uniref:GNAT family N-acetyltransferase n=1 Tax=unclassified Tamlana TaxID=2614803 RepID=UPI0026E48766|nr:MULTISPECIES: GNAT family N-acetyltransferase [unclassified Tamlana]MDO6759721.1 GNAT family N-acetyltransferase [Tamlana sp. 2_MG-2023]MDO6791344.1 GNAT family N-acetyltransferase [Tamlana sp. 1_MG-2023]
MIRKYINKDRHQVIELLRQNTPKYFASSEETDFENYLKNEVEDYFVYEQHSQIIGAGGINYFPTKKTARISWDMIHPNYHGKGIGKALTLYRINHLLENQNIEFIVVRTTQLAFQFYEKLGFKLIRIEKDFWAENFDLYEMKMPNKVDISE